MTWIRQIFLATSLLTICACTEKKEVTIQPTPQAPKEVKQPVENEVTFNSSEFAPFEESEFTDWQPITDHQMAFDAIDTDKLCVHHVEGRNHNGLSQFRMVVRPCSDAMQDCKVRYWMTDRSFWEYGISYQRKGYKRVSLQLYKDSSGVTRYQAVWMKPKSAQQ